MTKVICGFPGIGKSHFVESNDGEALVLDSDSTDFSWIKEEDGGRQRNPEFPQNYISHIARHLGNASFILVSSHPEVKEGLFEAEIEFTLAYPKRELKPEYMERYARRGSPEGFLHFMDENWDRLITNDETLEGCPKLVLGPGQYLSDVI